MLTLIIVIGLISVAIVIFLIPVLGGDESPSPSIPDSDDSRPIGAGFDNRAKAERLIEYEDKHNPATNADFIKKIIWIAVIAVAVFTFFYVSML